MHPNGNFDLISAVMDVELRDACPSLPWFSRCTLARSDAALLSRGNPIFIHPHNPSTHPSLFLPSHLSFFHSFISPIALCLPFLVHFPLCTCIWTAGENNSTNTSLKISLIFLLYYYYYHPHPLTPLLLRGQPPFTITFFFFGFAFIVFVSDIHSRIHGRTLQLARTLAHSHIHTYTHTLIQDTSIFTGAYTDLQDTQSSDRDDYD